MAAQQGYGAVAWHSSTMEGLIRPVVELALEKLGLYSHTWIPEMSTAVMLSCILTDCSGL